MSISDSTFGLPIKDLLTRVIPGFIFLLPLLLSSHFVLDPVFTDIPILAIALVIASFIVGELIDQIRITVYRVPVNFRRYLFIETGDPSKKPKIDEWRERLDEKIPLLNSQKSSDKIFVENRLSMDFRDTMERELGIAFDNDSPSDIYDLFLLHMEPNLNPRTRRQQLVYIMTSNVKIALIAALLLNFVVFLSFLISASVSTGQVNPVILFGSSLILTITIGMVCYLFVMVFQSSRSNYVEFLFKEFYLTHKN